jgi:error-prone DNA polymerase
MGLAILPPDVNASDWAYGGEGDRLRIGLMQVKTIPKSVATVITAERNERGFYRSFQDFLRRVKPEPGHARALVRAGCCDSLSGELTRPALLWRLYAGTDAESGALPIPDDYPTSQKRAHEIESFGFLASRHPLTLYCKPIKRLQPVPASQMHRFIGRRITMVGWLITEKPVETKHGQAMEFITLEDHTALYDATLFPDVYRRCSHLLSSNRAYIAQGVVEESFGVVTLTVLDLRWLDTAADDGVPSRTWYDDPCDATTDPPAHSSPLT